MSLFNLCALFAALSMLGLAASARADLPLSGTMKSIDGADVDLGSYKGKVVLVVNVASRCGFTPQYAGLQALHDAHKDEGLVVVGVPCNQFGAQEPGSAEEIATFCERNYGVTFPILEKQAVNGPKRSPLYASLVGSPAGGGGDIKWNFEKFLVGRDGQVRARFGSDATPQGEAITAAVVDALKK